MSCQQNRPLLPPSNTQRPQTSFSIRHRILTRQFQRWISVRLKMVTSCVPSMCLLQRNKHLPRKALLHVAMMLQPATAVPRHPHTPWSPSHHLHHPCKLAPNLQRIQTLAKAAVPATAARSCILIPFTVLGQSVMMCSSRYSCTKQK